MLDAHCHIDLYPDPTRVAQHAQRSGVATICVTNLPSAYRKAEPHVRQFSRLRLALGLHPLLAKQHAGERAAFAELANDVFYIGEVGLDFSPPVYSTKEIQIESFQFVLDTLRGKPKFVTLHSRRAEACVLEMLRAAGRSPVVFHWYSGSAAVLKGAIGDGHYFSVNPAMTLSPNGRKIIDCIPPERMLTETDGPFVKVGASIATPSDVRHVEDYISAVWRRPSADVRAQILSNFSCLLKTIKGHGQP